MKQVAGIILAGGMSRRFGAEKSLANIAGKEMVLYSMQAFKSMEDIIVVTRPDLFEKMPRIENAEIISDCAPYRGKGPLAGIFSAMSCMEAEWYAVLPCDVPWMEESVIQKLLSYRDEKWEIIVSRSGHQLQPLVAVFHCSTKAKIKAKLDQNQLSMRGLFADCTVKIVDFKDKKCFANINTKADLQEK